MPIINSAPELRFDSKKPSGQFYQIPQGIADIVFKRLGNSSAQIRIMMVLIGTAEGFKVSEQWILERTGLQSGSYIRARDSLIKMGWISHTPYKSIVVNYIKIMETPI